MNVIWLASYPKSGNTWLGTFLYHYFYGKPKSSSVIADFVPDIHDLLSKGHGLNEANPNAIICKTHFLYSANHPYIDSTKGFICLLRHPKDVLLSVMNFVRLCTDGEPIDEIACARQFIQEMGLPDYINQGMGDWPAHGGSWLSASRLYPHLFLHYEAMRSDPVSHFRRIIQFLGQTVDEEKLVQAVDAT
ncbi:MAG: sulfotransferase domain-containing protein, partial [Mariprofundales bacterium]|nr:sulfotransferase domain-containing protein [Mariprofundales bacterium]